MLNRRQSYERAACLALSLTIPLIGLQAAISSSSHTMDTAPVKHVLPGNAEPVSYKIMVDPNPERGRFTGTESIEINVLKATREIVLNSAELKLTNAEWSNEAPHAVRERVKASYRTELEQVDFELPQEAQPGKYVLSMSLEGILNDKLRGFYRSSYVDKSGKKHWLSTTQMEATDARRMFACFDEPQYKAVFSVSAKVDSDVVAISNSPIASATENKQTHTKLVKFQDTPKMSSYLLALIVGPFAATDPVTVDGVPIRVWTVAGKTSLGTYAQTFAAKLLAFYNSYFGVAYPAAKLDLIAIPDFEAGAMENLGAITFRETNLLVDEKSDSVSAKHYTSSVLAHEMAHMWFGDLVTMRWWDDLWLNEAFATWMSSKAVDKLKPDWHEWDQFLGEKLESMSSDSLHCTRPIHFSVLDPAQVDQMFDEITYGKGASVLRMLERYVGEDVFQSGVQKYIKAHAFSNASTQELWNSIGEAANKDINALMHEWVYQPGYPLISVDMLSHKNAMGAAQERFFLLNKSDQPRAFDTIWQVPLGFRHVEEGHSFADIERSSLTEKRGEIELKGDSPFLANAGADGYYRVRYTPSALKALSQDAQNSLTVSERASLLSDQFALAVAGKMPLQDYLTLTEQFRNESDPAVIGVITAQLGYLDLVVADKSRSLFQAFVRDRLAGVKAKLGWTEISPDESDLAKEARAEVLTTLGTIGQDETTIKEAREAFKKYKADRKSLTPDLVSPVITIVAYNGGEGDYNALSNLWHSATTPSQERQLLLSLSKFRQPALIEKTLAMALTAQVRSQDGPFLVSGIAGTAAGRYFAWKFITSHWHALNQHFPEHMVPRIVHGAASLITGRDEQEFQAFFQANPMPFGTRTIAKTGESIAINAQFRDQRGSDLSSWLAANLETKRDKVQPSVHQ